MAAFPCLNMFMCVKATALRVCSIGRWPTFTPRKISFAHDQTAALVQLAGFLMCCFSKFRH